MPLPYSNTVLKQSLQQAVNDPRQAGRESLRELVEHIPIGLRERLSARRFLLSLQGWQAFFPKSETKLRPWSPDKVIEEQRALRLIYRTEPSNVDYYLGFLEALVELCGDRTFISVQTLRNEVSFLCVFETGT